MPPRLPIRVALSRPCAAGRSNAAAIANQSRLLLPLTPSRGVRIGWSTAPPRSHHERYNLASPDLPAPTSGPAAALKRRERTTPLRAGLLATKKGMTSVFEGKNRVTCTVLQVDQVQVVANKNVEKHGYWAVQVGTGYKTPQNTSAAMLGYYEAKGMAPKADLVEFKVRNAEGLLPVGVQLRPDWFQVGQYVDVKGNSRGMGFAGGMKRHGFKGQEASHGNSKNHRTIGSVGPSQGSGSRVLPGKKMPGRMGNESVTVQNLKIVKVDNELGIVLVSGPVPGPKGRLLRVQDSKKRMPPGLEHRNKKLKAMRKSHPDSEQKLQAAREKHLEMKAIRQPKFSAQLDAPAA